MLQRSMCGLGLSNARHARDGSEPPLLAPFFMERMRTEHPFGKLAVYTHRASSSVPLLVTITGRPHSQKSREQ